MRMTKLSNQWKLLLLNANHKTDRYHITVYDLRHIYAWINISPVECNIDTRASIVKYMTVYRKYKDYVYRKMLVQEYLKK